MKREKNAREKTLFFFLIIKNIYLISWSQLEKRGKKREKKKRVGGFFFLSTLG